MRKYIERESETGEKGKTGFEESVTGETGKTGFEESDTNEEVEADTDTEGDVEQVCIAVIDEEECCGHKSRCCKFREKDAPEFSPGQLLKR